MSWMHPNPTDVPRLRNDPWMHVRPPELPPVLLVKVRALDVRPLSFLLDGKPVKPGQVVEVSEHDVGHLLMQGKVERI